jgi:hypothetical protein
LNRRRDQCNPYRENQQCGAVPAKPTSPLDALAQQVRGDVQAVPGLAGSLGAGALRAMNDPAATLQSATRYGQSLSRVLAPPQTSGSPLLARRGRSWRFAAIDVAFAGLPGCAAMITMVTHGDAGCVAVNFDAAAFTQPQRRSRPARRVPDHASGPGGHRTAVHTLSPSHCES